MALSLKESRAARDLASALYRFLPGSGNRSWKGHVTFQSIAEKVGVGGFWLGGSKEPAIAALLEATLEQARPRFESLIVEIVRAGLTYCERKGSPVTPQEIARINGLILEIGFKFPALWDRDFIRSLVADGGTRANQRVAEVEALEKTREIAQTDRNRRLLGLRDAFLALHAETDRQKAGLVLERLLTALFELHGLKPHEPFRVTGEQIDGSFELDNEVYLVEAKWQHEPCSAADLYVFREKIEGKSRFTRGVFLSINGIGEGAELAITKGKQPVFFAMNGHDLLMCLDGAVSLPIFLRQRQRILSETGKVSVAFGECDF